MPPFRTELEIERVTLHRVKIPLVEPFRISNGSVSEKEAVIVELVSGELVGFGEASPMTGSFYSTDTPESVWHALTTDLVPDLLRRTLHSPVDYSKALNDYSNEPFARAGLEGAVWDITAQHLGTSIAELLGADRKAIHSGVAIGMYDTVAELLERVDRFVRAGYQRVKIKIQPGWDVEPLAAIRHRWPELPLMVDANGAYNLVEHLEVIKALDGFGLMMIEQPLPGSAIEDAGVLQSKLETALCADESAESIESLAEIVRHKAARIINVKVQRVGGLWNARAMHDMCLQNNLDAWVGTMPELGIASAQGLAIATLPGFTYPTDIEASARWYVNDIVSPRILVDAHGLIHPPSGLGMGYAVDRQALERHTVHAETFER